VLKNKVIKLMAKNVGLFGIREALKERAVIKHLKLLGLLIDTHTSGRKRGRSGLIHIARDSRIERLVLQKAVNVHIEVKGHFLKLPYGIEVSRCLKSIHYIEEDVK
jgi:hypothetical protein